jgi:hypothetical protein
MMAARAYVAGVGDLVQPVELLGESVGRFLADPLFERVQAF